jgi:hypothetical protein
VCPLGVDVAAVAATVASAVHDPPKGAASEVAAVAKAFFFHSGNGTSFTSSGFVSFGAAL